MAVVVQIKSNKERGAVYVMICGHPKPLHLSIVSMQRHESLRGTKYFIRVALKINLTLLTSNNILLSNLKWVH
jgi:hypothetical protein